MLHVISYTSRGHVSIMIEILEFKSPHGPFGYESERFTSHTAPRCAESISAAIVAAARALFYYRVIATEQCIPCGYCSDESVYKFLLNDLNII